MTKIPGLGVSPAPDDISARLDMWATQLERAVEVLNSTLTEIKEIKRKEGPGERPGTGADSV